MLIAASELKLASDGAVTRFQHSQLVWWQVLAKGG